MTQAITPAPPTRSNVKIAASLPTRLFRTVAASRGRLRVELGPPPWSGQAGPRLASLRDARDLSASRAADAIRQGRDVPSSRRRATRGAAIFADRVGVQPDPYGVRRAKAPKAVERRARLRSQRDREDRSLHIARGGDDAVSLGCRRHRPLRYGLPRGPMVARPDGVRAGLRLVACAGLKDGRIAHAGFSAMRAPLPRRWLRRGLRVQVAGTGRRRRREWSSANGPEHDRRDDPMREAKHHPLRRAGLSTRRPACLGAKRAPLTQWAERRRRSTRC